MLRGGVAQLVGRWLQAPPGRFLTDILRCIVSVPLLIRLVIAIVIVRWRLASPGHLWVCGRKKEPCSSSRSLSVEGCAGLQINYKVLMRRVNNMPIPHIRVCVTLRSNLSRKLYLVYFGYPFSRGQNNTFVHVYV